MDRNGQTHLTRPATPKAFRVSEGRYSFVPANVEDGESIDLPMHLREERTNVPGTRT